MSGTQIWQQTTDDRWVPAIPLGLQGPLAKVEFWLNARGWKRSAKALGRSDEIGL